MKQNEVLLEKKVTKLEELHHILKKNVAKLEKTVSQCNSQNLLLYEKFYLIFR
jgi:hypothetical protein